jgi:hypothetical protein
MEIFLNNLAIIFLAASIFVLAMCCKNFGIRLRQLEQQMTGVLINLIKIKNNDYD